MNLFPDNFEPLLAGKLNLKKIDYSNLWASRKMDGIRAVVRHGVVVSRKLKPIPNACVQRLYGNRPELEGFDGELIVGPANAPDVYAQTYSGVMSKGGDPDVMFYAFDNVLQPTLEYCRRLEHVVEHRGIIKVQQHPITCEADLIECEGWFVDQGYEGLMGRTFQGPLSTYTFGRSSTADGTLLKWKRFVDFEAEIIGFEEEMHNGNEAEQDAFGRTKRSSHQENKTGKGTLGKIVCRLDGVTFKVGILKGITREMKQEIWNNPDTYIGQLARLQKFAIGEKDKPRHCKWINGEIRSRIDV